MRLANIDGRAHAVSDDGGVDLADASAGRFGPSPDEIVGHLGDVVAWLAETQPELDPDLSTGALSVDPSRLGPPVTRPPQIFAIGVNYASHGAETGIALPTSPMVFTKFASSLAGPVADIPIIADTVDWEVELVAVIGRAGRDIPAERAWDHMVGFCIGQDISERTLQMANTPPQFSLAKSATNFSPIGPWITTLDELDDPADLAISCTGTPAGSWPEVLQESRTRHMVFDIPALVEHLSSYVELMVGDLIFTGTPEGVGFGRTPPRYLEVGTVLTSTIEGLGQLTNTCVTPRHERTP